LRCTARIRDKEDRLVALDDSFGGDAGSQVGLAELEPHDGFLPVLDLEGGISHGIAP
jgi:hypothetical protein